ncbi:MAG: PAS domain S-box protein [Bacillota bacterium]
MDKNQQQKDKKTDLRERTEAVLSRYMKDFENIQNEEIRSLIEELQIRQAGLEIQNEELLRIQSELEKSRSKYFELFDFAPLGYFVLDDKGIIIQSNLTGSNMLGIGRKPLISKPFIFFIAPECRQNFSDHIQRVFLSTLMQSVELKIQRQNEISFYATLESIVIRDPDNGTKQCLSALIDINDRKMVEISLKEKEEDYRKLADSITDVFFAVDEHQKIIYWNRAAESLTGLPFSKAVGRNFHDAFNKIFDLDIDKILYHSRTSERPRFCVVECKTEKSIITYEANIYPYSKGQSVILKDITERKKAEAEITKSREEFHLLAQHLLNIREEERAHLAREIHDELGQRLTSFKLNLGWIRNALQKEGSQLNKEEFRDELNQMYLLVGDTINMIRRFVKDLKPTLLESLGLLDSIKWYLNDFSERFRIKYHFFTNLEDEQYSQQVITTLFRILQESLTNVAKHSNATQVEISVEEKGNSMILKVQDNGVGIEPSTIGLNHGFGIIGMRERAALLNGEFKISGLPGNGTIVEVKIPIRE